MARLQPARTRGLDLLRRLSYAATRRFDERQLIDLTMAIALENLYCRFNWALGIESEGFSAGMYCVALDAPSAETLARNIPAR